MAPRRQNPGHGSYPGDIGNIPKTRMRFKKEYYGLLTKYFSMRHYKGAGKYEMPTAESSRIGARLAELYDFHPDWADQTDEEWADDQRMNRPAEIWSNNPRRKKSNPRNRKLAIELPGTNLYVVGVGSDTNGNGVIRFKTPNGRAFSIQTAGWPDLHKVRSDLFAMAEIPSKDVKAFTQTATDYIKYYGSPAQKKSLRVYKSNPNDGLLKYQVWITKEGRGWVVHQLDNWDDFAEASETYFTTKTRAMAYKRQQEKLTVGGRNEGHLNPKRRRNSKALWSRNDWRIEWYDPQKKWRGFHIAGKNHSDHPTVYSLSRVGAETQAEVAFQRPESVPKYVQAALVRLALQYADDLDLRRSNPKRHKRAR